MFGRRDVAGLRDCYNGLHRILLFLGTRAELFGRCCTSRNPGASLKRSMPEDPPTPPANALQPFAAQRCKGGGFGIVYCLRTADKALDVLVGGLLFLRVLPVKKRANERTRTAD